MIRIFIGIFSALFLFGCTTFSTSDIPNYKEPTKLEIPKEKRKDVTFSVSFMQEVAPANEDIITNQQDLAEDIRDAFKEMKLFRKVHYVSPSQASNYHYHFNAIMTGTDYQKQFVMGLLGGYTLAIFPIWFNYNLDISMHLIVNGEEVYSVTAPQKVKDLLWLPLFFTWPIFNHGVVGNHVENKAINYFISEIIENQLYAYENKESYVEKIYPKIDVNLKR